MVFSRRERIIIAVTIAAVCLLALDWYVLTPVWDRQQAVRAERDRLILAKLAQDRLLKVEAPPARAKWGDMLRGGLRRDPAEAESQVLRSIRDWSADTGVRISSLRPERSTEKTELPEITVHVAGTGSMMAVSRLLWRIQTARIPIKTKMLQLGSRKDGTDDLSLHLRVSTLYLPPGEPASGGRDQPGNAAGDAR